MSKTYRNSYSPSDLENFTKSLNTNILDDPLYHFTLCKVPQVFVSMRQGNLTVLPTSPLIYVCDKATKNKEKTIIKLILLNKST